MENNNPFVIEVQLRWSDIDLNGHTRHSVYYDWGALIRVQFLNNYQLTVQKMQEQNMGFILLREECVFRREVTLEDPVTINLEVLKAKRDFSRWTIRHTIMKNPETVAAILTVEGACLDTIKRKLALPTPVIQKVFSRMPVHKEFQWIN